MKNKYFGDVNDYRKYGLLRCLLEVSKLRLGVCWMLTADDRRRDGELRRYLRHPARWRRFDPQLYDLLRRLLKRGVARTVKHAEGWDLMPGATYFWHLLEDDHARRKPYFERVWQKLAGAPLLFLDPDNGIEVKSVRRGSRRSSKYIYWNEIETAYARGHSLVLYQHFRREARAAFIQGIAKQLRERLKVPSVEPFKTAHVVFFLVSRPEHVSRLQRARDCILRRWQGQIEAGTGSPALRRRYRRRPKAGGA